MPRQEVAAAVDIKMPRMAFRILMYYWVMSIAASVGKGIEMHERGKLGNANEKKNGNAEDKISIFAVSTIFLTILLVGNLLGKFGRKLTFLCGTYFLVLTSFVYYKIGVAICSAKLSVDIFTKLAAMFGSFINEIQSTTTEQYLDYVVMSFVPVFFLTPVLGVIMMRYMCHHFNQQESP